MASSKHDIVVATPGRALDRILDMENPTSAIVFCRTRLEVDTLAETLNAHGYRAEALHGGMEQRQRDAVMNRVRSGKTDLLIATGRRRARARHGGGRKAGRRPADLVGAITGEAGVTSKSLGAIEIGDNFSLIEVSEESADDIVRAMKGASLRGQKVTIRRDRDSATRSATTSGAKP